MPELPDVEVFRQWFQDHALHERVKDVDVKDAKLCQPSGAEVTRAATGRTFGGTKRHGKWLLVSFEDGRSPWLAFHFGMTGRFREYEPGDDAPEHEKVRLDLGKGTHLAFLNRRRLGRVVATEGPDALARDKDLGPDALLLQEDEFVDAFAGKTGMLKPALMDQHAVAGIGNIYADEILHQERLHPQTPANALDDAQWRALYAASQDVLRAAIDARVVPKRMPDDWITPVRGKKHASCPACGGTLTRTKVSGRTTVFCGSCQGKP